MIQLLHVSKRYPPNLQALTDICLKIHQGEFVFITGPSGAGKTTLLKLLFRGEEPSEGEILLNGQNVNRLNSRGVARLRRGIGLVFQEFKLLPRLTALENVALAAEVVGTSKRESCIRAYHLLRELGLKEKCDAKPLMLSGGEQQRVAIARALVNDPLLVLADEPTGDLDSENAEEVLSLMALLNRQAGMTFVMVTHDPRAAAKARRLVHLEKGRLADAR